MRVGRDAEALQAKVGLAHELGGETRMFEWRIALALATTKCTVFAR